MLASASASMLTDAPLTTGALFIALTAAITYLYRARDTDRDSEKKRLLEQIDRLEHKIDRLTKLNPNEEQVE